MAGHYADDGSTNVTIVAGAGVTSASTVADGADIALGAKADAAWVSGVGTVISLLKTIANWALNTTFNANGQALKANSAPVVQAALVLKTVSGTLTADTDVIAAVTSKRIKVVAYSIITTGTSANALIFKSNGTAGTELWRLFLQAPTASSVFGANLAMSLPSYLFATVAGEKLTIDVGNTDAVHYSITYTDDDAT